MELKYFNFEQIKRGLVSENFEQYSKMRTLVSHLDLIMLLKEVSAVVIIKINL